MLLEIHGGTYLSHTHVVWNIKNTKNVHILKRGFQLELVHTLGAFIVLFFFGNLPKAKNLNKKVIRKLMGSRITKG